MSKKPIGTASKGGRPSIFTQELADFMCAEIASGQSLIDILEAIPDAPAYGTVMRWCEEKPEFCEKYTRARSFSGHYYADRIGKIERGVAKGEIEPNAGRVSIDALKWMSGKRMPKVYGDKTAVEHSGSVTLESLVNTSFGVGEAVVESPDPKPTVN